MKKEKLLKLSAPRGVGCSKILGKTAFLPVDPHLVSILKDTKKRDQLTSDEKLAFYANHEKQKLQQLKNNLEAIMNEEKQKQQDIDQIARMQLHSSRSMGALHRSKAFSATEHNSRSTTNRQAKTNTAECPKWMPGTFEFEKAPKLTLFDSNHTVQEAMNSASSNSPTVKEIKKGSSSTKGFKKPIDFKFGKTEKLKRVASACTSSARVKARKSPFHPDPTNPFHKKLSTYMQTRSRQLENIYGRFDDEGDRNDSFDRDETREGKAFINQPFQMALLASSRPQTGDVGQ